jgi:hypothetical protein
MFLSISLIAMPFSTTSSEETCGLARQPAPDQALRVRRVRDPGWRVAFHPSVVASHADMAEHWVFFSLILETEGKGSQIELTEK